MVIGPISEPQADPARRRSGAGGKRGGASASAPKALARAQRDREALRLHQQGLTYDRVAKEVGVANKGVAHKMVARALERAPSPRTRTQCMLEFHRAQFLGFEAWRRFDGDTPLGGSIPIIVVRDGKKVVEEPPPESRLLAFIDEHLEWQGHNKDTLWSGLGTDHRTGRPDQVPPRDRAPRHHTRPTPSDSAEWRPGWSAMRRP